MKTLKNLICFALILTLAASSVAFANPSDTEDQGPQHDISHLAAMMQAAAEGSASALQAGAAAEERWNQQIRDEQLNFAATSFFETLETAEEIAVAIARYLISKGISEINGAPFQFTVVAPSKQIRQSSQMNAESVGAFPFGTIVTVLAQDEDSGWVQVTDGTTTGWCTNMYLAPFDGTQTIRAPGQGSVSSALGQGDAVGPGVAGGEEAAAVVHDDLFWLALTIQMEAGSVWLSDEHQLMVGSVVLNRVAHPNFPNTIHGVLHQRGQYCFIMRGARQTPSERAFANAQRLLDGGSILPPNVVFQAEFPQGSGVHHSIRCDTLGNTTFFSYF